MMDIRVQGYENQVKLFLVLLVLFLVASGVVGLNVLYRSRALLIEEAESRITSASHAVQREVAESGLAQRLLREDAADPQTLAAAGAHLRDLARAYSISSVEVVDLKGRVIAGTQPWRLGIIDPEAAGVAAADLGALTAGGAVIREPAPAGPRAEEEDEAEYGRDRGEVL